MNIVDTYDSMIVMLDNMNGIFNMAIWESYASKISKYLPDKLRKYIASYSFPKVVFPVIKKL